MKVLALLTSVLLVVSPISTSRCDAAIDAACAWEIRTTGNSLNGGGWIRGAAGTDYSQQDAAEESYTTLATPGAGSTTVTCSGADTFDANIVGNIVYIYSGTNFTSGRYEVTARASSTSITFDSSPTPGGAGGGDGIGYMGGAGTIVGNPQPMFDVCTAGNKVWIEAGTYTFTGNLSTAVDGTIPLFIDVEGYNATRGDNPTGTNRPLLAASSYDCGFDNYWAFKNFRVTTTHANGFNGDTSCHWENVKVENSSTSSFRDAFQGASKNRFIRCEASSIEGEAMLPGSSALILSCYIRDSHSRGLFWSNNDHITVAYSVIDTCYLGADLTTGNTNITWLNNAFINCPVGQEYGALSTTESITYRNNMFLECGDAVHADNGGTEPCPGQMNFDYNLWFGNDKDMSWDNGSTEDNDPKGDNAVNSDPTITASIYTGTNGSTDGAGTTLTIDSTSGMDTDDAVAIFSGTGVTVGIYNIDGVPSGTTLTLDRSAGSSASSITFGIVKGEDFTLQAGSPAEDAGLQPGTDIGLTGDYKHNISVDQDDNTAGGVTANGALMGIY